jgi:hypothetical protein
MLGITRYSGDASKSWDAFCNSAKNPLFMFNRGYMDYHSDRFTDHSLLFHDDGELIALLPMNEKGPVLFSHGGLTYGGFITDAGMKQHTMNDLFGLLIGYARDNGFQKLVYKTIPHMYHSQPAEEDLYALFLNGATVAKVEPSTVLYLKNPLKMPKGRKAQIGRARREGIIVRRSEDFGAFMDIENSVLRKYHNTNAVHSKEEMTLLNSRFPEQIRLYAAYLGGEMVAGAVIFEYPHVIHTQYMAADEKARELGALDLVIASIMEEYKESKDYLDFGISSEDSGKSLNEGLISQKEGFGGRTNVYVTYELSL